ncbi:hypothetical protein ERO13_A13G121200v2 [Gossypium hirsutum]|uniref:Subtilisin-like protease SBT3.17 n=1 Tax=Gossypium hirsutum TaxID=3635 RepID=A0ABM2ZH84_GOSHI|nr:subtilisin-like protease SBT3.17 [Gossypium hirsutum]KAG4166289.1 hypothetical protein ERO13_A13G121200v2 [Gossypium hirsutum]
MSINIFPILFCSIIALCCLIQMAESTDATKSSSAAAAAAGGTDAAVHIVYTERPQDEQPEAYHIRTLSNVLGSEEAAKEALIYSYKTAASGFSAKLTPQQVAEISKQLGVLQVVPSRTLQLHSGPGKLH